MAACLLSMAGSRGGARPLAAGTGALPPEGRAVLTALRFHGSPDKHPALKFRTDVRRLTVSHCFLSQGHSLLQTFTLICLLTFLFPSHKSTCRKELGAPLPAPSYTANESPISTSYLACNHFPDKGGGEMMAGGQPGSDSFSWSRRS